MGTKRNNQISDRRTLTEVGSDVIVSRRLGQRLTTRKFGFDISWVWFGQMVVIVKTQCKATELATTAFCCFTYLSNLSF